LLIVESSCKIVKIVSQVFERMHKEQ
jgi:hypothetical protein